MHLQEIKLLVEWCGMVFCVLGVPCFAKLKHVPFAFIQTSVLGHQSMPWLDTSVVHQCAKAEVLLGDIFHTSCGLAWWRGKSEVMKVINPQSTRHLRQLRRCTTQHWRTMPRDTVVSTLTIWDANLFKGHCPNKSSMTPASSHTAVTKPWYPGVRWDWKCQREQLSVKNNDFDWICDINVWSIWSFISSCFLQIKCRNFTE